MTPEGTRIERDARQRLRGRSASIPRMPSSAATHRCASSRDGHAVESRADVGHGRSTATDFDLTIDLVVTVDDEPPVTRRWVERIPRELL